MNEALDTYFLPKYMGDKVSALKELRVSRVIEIGTQVLIIQGNMKIH